MKVLSLCLLVLLTGCHPGARVRIGSPQFQRAPEICIIFVQGDKISVELAKAAIEACKTAGEEKP